MTTEQFIEKARKKHGDRYDYSKTEYVSCKDKLCIICHEVDQDTGVEHGEFWQLPSNHLKGKGCKKCASLGNRKRFADTKEKFIEKAKKVHGDKYDYSKVEYVNANRKVCIICHEIDPLTGKEHGEFMQKPGDHIMGDRCGCPKCAPNKKMNDEDFVLKLKQVFKDENYDYSQTKYVDYKTESTVICPKHGLFKRLPPVLLRGCGCALCIQGEGPYTTEEFISMAKEVHGDKYDYSGTVFTALRDRTDIRCPKHGVFNILPREHLNGKGCPQCLADSKWTREKFIEEANKVHGDKYDYSKVEFITMTDKVCIVCHEMDPYLKREHGEFWQSPSNHLNSRGCPRCNGHFMDQELFIAKSSSVHNNKYRYDKVRYFNNSTKVTITCPIHGDFQQCPSDHMSGEGCMECGGHKKLDTESFIQKAKEVHGDKYDYSLVDYVNNGTKVKIICPKHGVFEQAPREHLSGAGCRYCNQNGSRLENFTKNVLTKYYSDIEFEREKGFEWLKRDARMYLDFYLPQYNAAIECQGIQHFEECDGMRRSSLKDVMERDKLKKKLCEEHGIRVFYFSQLKIDYPYHVYEDFSEMMEDIRKNKASPDKLLT